MREIKFRVWEPCNEKMHHLDFALYKFDGGLNSHKFVLPPNKQGFQNPYSIMNLEAVKVMQYTGLNDKNGKEIYEGDILKETTEEGYEIGEVLFKRGGFRFKSDKTFCQLSWCETKNTNVIGNIYENPELLGGAGE